MSILVLMAENSATEAKKRLHIAIQRDRLSNFLKDTRKTGKGCMYYALLGAHDFFYPQQTLPHHFEKTFENRSLGVMFDSGFQKEMERMEPQLGLKLTGILLNSGLSDTEQEWKSSLGLAQEFPLEKVPPATLRDALKPTDDRSSNVALFLNPGTSICHAIHVRSDETFKRERGLLLAGGKHTVDIMRSEGGKLIGVIRLEKSR